MTISIHAFRVEGDSSTLLTCKSFVYFNPRLPCGRRPFSTRMSAAGAREEDIIALMGHAEYKTDINHYIIQELDTLYDAVKKLA